MMVLDTSALLALLFSEPGAEHVRGEFEQARISTVNVAEVLSRFSRDGHDAGSIQATLERTTLRVIDFSRTHAACAAALLPLVQHRGLSLGDRACLALALDINSPVLTADRAWDGLDVGVEIRLIR